MSGAVSRGGDSHFNLTLAFKMKRAMVLPFFALHLTTCMAECTRVQIQTIAGGKLSQMRFQLSALIGLALIVGSAVGQTINLECDPGGTVAQCGSFANAFCTSIANITIGPGDSATRCFTATTANIKCDFTALNTHTISNNINVANCEAALQLVNSSCPMGGWGQVDGAAFRFFGDPNTGVCTPPCGN
ncbi:hypothetical protein C8F01DRAFT_1367558 [Mycena amicta]|nr:hypothetical protein C8F01DRAFT_1367558 [Mycena amicta]